MKYFAFIFLISFLFISCKSDINSTGNISSSGVIKVLEASAWMYGTHIFVDNKGKVIYALRSSQINLNNYIDMRVTISGDLVKGYPVDGGPEYLEVKSVTQIR
ncbi:MAG: hypothetical protein ACM3RX_10650 [Methanococcaceae archaeon]